MSMLKTIRRLGYCCLLSQITQTQLKLIIGMQSNVSSEGKPRPKEPSQLELRNMKVILQRLTLPSKHEVCYNLVTKESKSGFFDNERLIVLNTKDRSFGYLSKLPEGLIPLLSEEEVKSLKFKALVTRTEILNGEVKEFKCQQVTGKLSTFEFFYKRGNRSEVQQWLMTLGNPTLMKEWVELVNNTLLKDQPEPKPEPVYEPPPLRISQKVLNQNISPPPMSAYKQPEPVPQPPKPNFESQVPKHDSSSLPQGNVNNSIIHVSTISYDEPQHIQSSRIANLPYSDHIGELKYLKLHRPELFKLNNDLSKKKMQPVQVENSNSLNVYGYRPVESHLRDEEERRQSYVYEGRRSKLESSGSKIMQNRYDEVYGPEKEPSRKHLTNSQLVIQSLPKSQSNMSNPPFLPQNREYKPYVPYNMDPKITISASPFGHPPTKKSQFQTAFENPITNSRNQLADSKKNITIQYQQNSRSDIGYRRESQVRFNANDERESQNRQSVAGRSTVNRGSLVSKGGFSSRGMARKKWNEVFAETSNKLDIYEEFIQTCFNVVREIVNELPLDSNRREYLPIQARPPFFTYYNEGIIITLHHFSDSKNISNSNAKNSPVLFDQSTYELLKRQFYNYNLVLAVTANEGFIKVPLCAYFEYKGILALCKAQIPQSFSEVTPKRYEKQFQIIENQIHLRFAFGSFNAYQQQSQKYIILDNMKEFIPELTITREGSFFRKEFLLGYENMVEDQEGCSEAHSALMQKNLPDLLGKLESIETYIVNSTDLMRLFHEEGLSLAYLPLAIQQTPSPFLKRLFLSELSSIIFTSIFRSELNNLYSSFAELSQHRELTLDETHTLLVDSAHTLIDMLFGYSNNAQNLWKIVVEQCRSRYKVVISKDDVIPGYLLASVVERMGVQCNFRKSSFNKHEVDFFARNGNLPRDLFEGFRMKIRRYDLEAISTEIESVKQILSSEPTPDNFQLLVSNLDLKAEAIPNYLYPLEEPLLAYLCNFVPYSQHEQFQHIGIYNMVLLQPNSYYSTKCSLLALKWCIKKKLNEQALRIFEMKELQNAFWQGEYNPAISEFYDFFAMYNASVGQYEQAIQLAKLSLKNTMQVAGASEIPVADKHYQLGNIFFKMGRKEEALRQYSKTKQILMLHQQTQISEYAVILLKLAVLFLNFGKIVEAVHHSLQALKIFDTAQSTETDQIGTFEILARCYEITKKHEELENICDLAASKFNETEDCLIFQRMVKLMLHVKLKKLSSPQSKAFLSIVSKLEEQVSEYTQMEAFSYLNRKCQEGLLTSKIQHFLSNIVYLFEEATKKDLFKRYKSLDPSPRNEAEDMLVTVEAVGIIIGFGFMLGSLREVYE